MAKRLHFSSDNQEKFYNEFSTLCTSRMIWEVWLDIITIYAIMIANALDQQGAVHEKREEEYKQIIVRYTESEQNTISVLFTILVHALQVSSEQDFLGEIFMQLGLSDHWKGQFFSPYSACKAMAKINLRDAGTIISKNGWFCIMDPTCGAGATLIAARNDFAAKGFGFESTLFIAQDLDRLASMMCFIQLSLLGCAGYVVVADSFLNPPVGPKGNPLLITPTTDQEIWVMPAFYSDVWATRIMCERMRLATEIIMRGNPNN